MEHLEGVQGAELEREMFILRKLIEKEKMQRIAALGGDPADFYICTMSNRTIVYKVPPRSRQMRCMCCVQRAPQASAESVHVLMGSCMPVMQLSSTSAVLHMLQAISSGLSLQPACDAYPGCAPSALGA